MVKAALARRAESWEHNLERDQTQRAGLLTAITAGGGLSVLIGAGVILVDQIAKRWAAASLSMYPDGNPSVLHGWLTLIYTTNTGAAFGVLADRGVLLLLIGLVILTVVVAYRRFLPGHPLMLRVSLGLQLGGAAGNLLDRVRVGHVIDFIQIRYWPVFNLADSSIVVGVALLMYYLLLSPDGGGTGGKNRGDER